VKIDQHPGPAQFVGGPREQRIGGIFALFSWGDPDALGIQLVECVRNFAECPDEGICVTGRFR
jgi:hypothetical protein